MQSSIIYLSIVAFVLGLASSQNIIEKNCDPNPTKRFDECPAGYCCVRDEYMPTYVYCKKIGKLNDNCTTRESESECPCANGLICQPNIADATIRSLYGKCANATNTNGHERGGK